jgi:octaprenyl-diphosphate synthase
MAFAVQLAKGIFDLVRDDLALVEQEIAAQNSAAIAPVCEISSYLREGGGKRLRPALLLLAAGASGYRGESAIRLGAVVEMIHSATLIHDDVIDGADTRRGRPSANARWGNHMSVLAGDWLYMQSFEMALRERNFAVLDILIDLTQNMVEGELLQLTRLGRMDLNEAEATELRTARRPACSADARGSAPYWASSPRKSKTASRITAAMPASRFSWWTICSISPRRRKNWANRC